MARAIKRQVEPTATELALAARSAHVHQSALPISDPFLAGVSEQLHRICDAQSLEVARWMAADALVLLRSYVTKQQGAASRNA